MKMLCAPNIKIQTISGGFNATDLNLKLTVEI